MQKLLYISLILAFLIIFSGCSEEYILDIKSDTHWTLHLQNQEIEGQRNEQFKIENEFIGFTDRLQKNTKDGFIKARIITKTDIKDLVGDDGGYWIETKAEYGIIYLRDLKNSDN